MKTKKIPKQGSKSVYIVSPDPKLKNKHKELYNKLKQLITPSKYAFAVSKEGYDKMLKFIDNSSYLHVDLKSAFESVTYSRIIGVLRSIKLPNPKIEAAHITYNGTLMRGASPSNLILEFILTQTDYRLEGLARQFGLFYARYVDDMFFFGSDLPNTDELLPKIKTIVEAEGFALNIDKINIKRQMED